MDLILFVIGLGMVKSKSGLYDVTSSDVFYGPCIYNPYSDAGLDPEPKMEPFRIKLIFFCINYIRAPPLSLSLVLHPANPNPVCERGS